MWACSRSGISHVFLQFEHLTAWSVKQTVTVSAPRWLKSVKGARFIGEAVFSMTSKFLYSTLTGEILGVLNFSSSFLVLPLLLCRDGAPGIQWIIDTMTCQIMQSNFYRCWALEIHWNRKIAVCLHSWKWRQKFLKLERDLHLLWSGII